MRLTRALGGVFFLCFCTSFAFLMASRTTTDDPALVTFTDLGVVFGLEAKEALDWGVVGVMVEIALTGVVGREREGLNEETGVARGRATDAGGGRVVRREESGVLVDRVVAVDGVDAAGGGRAGFLAESNWRSRASRRDSMVRPAREDDGVCGRTAE
jgi:hypothetical protein